MTKDLSFIHLANRYKAMSLSVTGAEDKQQIRYNLCENCTVQGKIDIEIMSA